MAWQWNTSPVSTIKVEEADSTNTFTINGCTNSNSVNPEQAVSFINILLGIGGKVSAVSSKMKRTSSADAVSDS